MSLRNIRRRWYQGHIARDRRVVDEARASSRRPLVPADRGAWLLVACFAGSGASGCTQLLFDGTRARVDDVAPQDSSVADQPDGSFEDVVSAPNDAGVDQGELGDLGSEIATIDAPIASIPDADAARGNADGGPGPYGPWTFASDDDLTGWEVIAPLGSVCTMERDPAGGGSLKITYTTPSCILAHANRDLDLHDRRLKVRIRGENTASDVTHIKLFSQAGTVVVKAYEQLITMAWSELSILIAAPGAPNTYDPTKVLRFGALLEGAGGTVWVDGIELAKEASLVRLPSFEFTDSLGELGVHSADATNISTGVENGYARVKGTIGKLTSFAFGQRDAIDLSRAQSLRTRFRTVGAPNVRLYMTTGPGYAWFLAPMDSAADYSEWTEIAWDLSEVPDREYVRGWGFEVFGVAGDVELDVDWIHIEDTPLSAADAGPEVGDASSADSGDSAAVDPAVLRPDVGDAEDAVDQAWSRRDGTED